MTEDPRGKKKTTNFRYPGLSFVKLGARWSFAFEHNGTRFHNTLETYPEGAMKKAKPSFFANDLPLSAESQTTAIR